MEEFYDVDENHVDYRSNVDVSRPFRSVKEAVAVFGERIMVGEIYSSKQPFSFPEKETPIFSPSPHVCLLKHSSSGRGQNDASLSDTVKKLEAELEETRAELKLLKEKESETEVALAVLNAELHESMLKLAQVDLAISGSPVRGVGDTITRDDADQEEKRESRTSTSQSLKQILSVAQNEGLFWGKKKGKKPVKKKPIIPLVGGLFSGKKGTSTRMYTSLHSSSHMHWS
ncbi:WEB family protein [Dorcoceras hygrometricum]|uniref:WEB family protein n=1 Tax=Dorcoceras hygrometricum TaxID=472368 RepID=A0A2Z7CV16_9LAMI|nr:WEB family protein [Dorcoceras hygrometricum]